jgi:hypothetical protein
MGFKVCIIFIHQKGEAYYVLWFAFILFVQNSGISTFNKSVVLATFPVWQHIFAELGKWC